IFKFSDTALHGFLGKCERAGISRPIVAYELLGEFDQVITKLELAWPKSKQCIVIRKDDAKVAKKQKWTAWSVIDALENFSSFERQIY
ncbi:MAG: HNH endonuclease, partial [Methyloprofundus sp.]|nr:HNH endonuclease [Methyloprofundus sp.]